MAKAPPNTPEKGDRCIERGKPDRVGTMIKHDPRPGKHWVTVEWDNTTKPMICHKHSLEKIDD